MQGKDSKEKKGIRIRAVFKAANSIEVQPLKAPTGQIFTLKFPKIKKDNIFKRIGNKIKW